MSQNQSYTDTPHQRYHYTQTHGRLYSSTLNFVAAFLTGLNPAVLCAIKAVYNDAKQIHVYLRTYLLAYSFQTRGLFREAAPRHLLCVVVVSNQTAGSVHHAVSSTIKELWFSATK